jgi:hypothetical protein
MGALLAGGALSIANPAMAETAAPLLPPQMGLAQCESLHLACLWEDGGAQGNLYDEQASIGRWNIDSWDGDNEISSIVNATNYCAKLWDNDNWTGTGVVIRPHAENLNLGSFNDKAESWQLYAC